MTRDIGTVAELVSHQATVRAIRYFTCSTAERSAMSGKYISMG